MFNTQKNRSYQNNFARSRAVNAGQWDHSGFDQLEQEEKAFQHSKSNKFNKFSNRNQKRGFEATLMSDSNSLLTIEKDVSPIETKWLHDKFEDTLSLSIIEPEEENVIVTQKKPRRERKPDRQLYNVRNKQGANGNSTSTREEKARTSGCFEESLQAIEDDKSFISNVSTAMSDRLKNCEDENTTRSEITNDHSKEKKTVLVRDEADKTIEIIISIQDKLITERLNEDEEDFQKTLEQMCSAHNITGRMALYFKINLLQYVQCFCKSPNRKLETYLDGLLDENYSLIVSEQKLEEQQDLILEHLNDEEDDSLRHEQETN